MVFARISVSCSLTTCDRRSLENALFRVAGDWLTQSNVKVTKECREGYRTRMLMLSTSVVNATNVAAAMIHECQ
jgi:hypothetical protein